MKQVQIDGVPILLIKFHDQFFAIQDTCTHELASLCDGELGESFIECGMHGSQFDITTGEVVLGPADVPLAVYQVSVEGDQISLVLPEDQVPVNE